MTTVLAEQYIQAMTKSFRPEKAGGLTVTYQLQLTGPGAGTWIVAVANGQCQISHGALFRADTIITMSTDSYLKLAANQLNVRSAYQNGEVKVQGNVQHALTFSELFSSWASLVSSEPTTPTSPSPSPPSEPVPTPTPTEPAPTSPPTTPSPATPTLADYVAAMPSGLRADRVGGLQATYQFQLSGNGGGNWIVSVANRTATVFTGSGRANVTISMSGPDFIKLAEGNLNTTQAYRQGKVQISGDVNLASRIADIFGPWAGTVGSAPTPAPAPTPSPSPAPTTPTPTTPTPAPGSAYARLMNSSFDEYQPFVYEGEAKVWKESQFPEEYGKYWTLGIHDVGKGRPHMMNSGVFGPFTQKYFGGGGHDYHIEGDHSQVITSRYSFKLTLSQTVTAQPGRDYKFSGSIVSYYKGTSGERADGKIFKALGIDPTGGQNYDSNNVIWTEQDGKDNAWRYPSVTAKAQAGTITVHILLENVEKDVGSTELNIIHLDAFKLE